MDKKVEQPKFGDWMRNTHASADNPIRDGRYVRTITRTGRVMNPGTCYELTDGKGKFWQTSPEFLVASPAASEQETCPTCGSSAKELRLCRCDPWVKSPHPTTSENYKCGDAWHTSPIPPSEPFYESQFEVWTCPLCETSDDTKEALAKHICPGKPANSDPYTAPCCAIREPSPAETRRSK